MQKAEESKKNILSKEYFEEINIARAIALLAVVLGHSFPDIETGMTNPVAQWLVKYVYSFHMGCFFVLAGFVAGNKLKREIHKNGDFIREVIRKAKRLLVPYFFWSIVVYLLKQTVLSKYANHGFGRGEFIKIFFGVSPNGEMWYLWILFIISIIFYLLSYTPVIERDIILMGGV